MKTSFLLALVLSAASSFADDSLSLFKSELSSRLGAMGDSMHKALTADMSYAVSQLRVIMGSSTYKVCTDSRRDNTRNDRKKMEQIEACQSVGEMTKRLSAEVGARDKARNARIDLPGKEQALIVFVNALTHPQRKALGVAVHKDTTTEFNRHNEVLTKMANDETATTKSVCWNLPLSKSVNCAMNRTVDLLQSKMPSAMANHRAQMDRAMAQALNRVAAYQDPVMGLASVTDENGDAFTDEDSEECEEFSSSLLLEAVVPGSDS